MILCYDQGRGLTSPFLFGGNVLEYIVCFIFGMIISWVLNLKYLVLEESNRSEQNITAQKYIDQLNIDTVKKTIMKNYVLAFPSSYEHILEYKTWEEMESFINKTLKEEQGK